MPGPVPKSFYANSKKKKAKKSPAKKKTATKKPAKKPKKGGMGY